MFNPSQATSNTPNLNHPPRASQIWMAMLGFSLCVMGAIGCLYLWLSYQKARQTDHWVERPAKVIVSTIDSSTRTQHNDVKYRLEVHYRYQYKGESYLSSRVKILPLSSRDPGKIKKHQNRYPVGSNVTCYVNPDKPLMAILIKPTKAALYSIWFPALLILFGLKMILGIFSKNSCGSIDLT